MDEYCCDGMKRARSYDVISRNYLDRRSTSLYLMLTTDTGCDSCGNQTLPLKGSEPISFCPYCGVPVPPARAMIEAPLNENEVSRLKQVLEGVSKSGTSNETTGRRQ